MKCFRGSALDLTRVFNEKTMAIEFKLWVFVKILSGYFHKKAWTTRLVNEKGLDLKGLTGPKNQKEQFKNSTYLVPIMLLLTLATKLSDFFVSSVGSVEIKYAEVLVFFRLRPASRKT